MEWYLLVVVVQLENWSIEGIFYGFIESCDFALLLLKLRTNSGHLRDIIVCTFAVHLSDSVRLIELHKSDCSYSTIFCVFCFSLDEIIPDIFYITIWNMHVVFQRMVQILNIMRF